MDEAPRRVSLARGLGALLGESDNPQFRSPVGAGGVNVVRLDCLRPNPDQPRKDFAQEDLDELAASMKERGVLQPLLVRPSPNGGGQYEIVAGERRWRAARLAGIAEVPVLVRTDLSDVDLLEIGVIENVQRKDLKPLEEAEAYRTLIDRFGRTQDEVARAVGKSRSHVANAIRLLALPPVARAALSDGELTAGHARAIAAAEDPDSLARTVVDKKLTVREAEALARDVSRGSQRTPPAPQSQRKSEDAAALEQDLASVLGLKVEITERNGRPSIRIDFNSLAELDAFCRRSIS